MAHDATKVVLGATLNSAKVISNHAGAPATFLAGLAVSVKTDDTLSLLASDGKRQGVSMGRSLSDEDMVSIVRKGLKVPMRFDNYAHGVVTITSYANLIDDTDDTLQVGATVFTAQAGAATPGQATFQAATSNTATATSLAAQINAHATASTVVDAWSEGAVVFLRALDEDAVLADLDLVYDDVDGTGDSVGLTVSGATLTAGGSTVLEGAVVYVSEITGKAVDSDDINAAATSAVYAKSGLLTGIAEDGSEVSAVLVDMIGGL